MGNWCEQVYLKKAGIQPEETLSAAKKNWKIGRKFNISFK